MKPKTFYYKDELNDDFGNTGLKRPQVDDSYKYIRKNKINNFFSGMLYYLVAVPVLGLGSFLLGVRVKNRKNLKPFKKKPIFIYANHTAYIDAFIIQSFVTPYKRTNILGYSDASTIPVAKHICRACGYLPVSTTISGAKNLQNAIKHYTSINQNILIYPEAHIWPKYTKIRPFVKTSFHYPAKLNIPIIPIVTVYRKSKITKHAKMTLVIGEPIYPKEELNDIQNKQYLRDECYNQMVKISSSYDQYEYHRYEKVVQD